MKAFSFLFFISLSFVFTACAQKKVASTTAELKNLPEVIVNPDEYNELNLEEAYVIRQKGTERSFTGAYHDYKGEGVYICKQCNNPLFLSNDKFDSGTGWPSFDDAIAGAVKEVTDADGYRTEILCANCDGHLGHVFRGEGFTSKQTRHCVNSVSLNFVAKDLFDKPEQKKSKNGIYPISEYIKGKGYERYEVATFAGGCFWCTEAAFERIQGVEDVISGYAGGTKKYPTYKEVGAGQTNHAESIIIYYDPEVIDYKTLLEVFFIAHDPTQLNRQGPDVGKQYRSAVFYHNEEQENQALATIKALEEAGKYNKPVVTEVKPYKEFWVAEDYHQDFYRLNPNHNYVQAVSKPKVEKVEKTFADLLKPKNEN